MAGGTGAFRIFPGVAEQVQRMARYIELQQLAHGAFDLLNARIAELEDAVAHVADQVIVLPETVRSLIQREVLAKLVLGHQTCIQQQIERIVYRSPAYAVVPVLHVNIQGLYIKMFFAGIDLVKDGKTFGRLALLLLLQKLYEQLLYFLLYSC